MGGFKYTFIGHLVINNVIWIYVNYCFNYKTHDNINIHMIHLVWLSKYKHLLQVHLNTKQTFYDSSKYI